MAGRAGATRRGGVEQERWFAFPTFAEFLYETRLYPDQEYTFKHALTHEVAYEGVLHESRRALHAWILEAIEGLHRDRLAEQVDRLAHHTLRGEAWVKAILTIATTMYREMGMNFWLEKAEAALGPLHS